MTILFENSQVLFDYALKGKRAGNINMAPLLEQLPAAARPLQTLLNSSPVQEMIDDYNRDNTQANRLQARYLGARRLGYWAAFVATLIGVLFLFPFMQWLDRPYAKIALLILEASCIVLIWRSRKTSHDLQETFVETRFAAETCRLELFARLINGAFKSGGKGEILRPALDFVAHYLVKDQYDYYCRRGKAHEKKVEKAVRWRRRASLVYKILFLFSLPALVLLMVKQGWLPWLLSGPFLAEGMTQHQWLQDMMNRADSALAGMGVLVSAVHSLTVSMTRLELSERNTATYADMANELKQALEGLPGLQAQAENNDGVAVSAFVNSIVKRLRGEQEGWRELQKIVQLEFGAE